MLDRERRRPRHRQPQPGRGLSPVPHLRPAQARGDDRCATRASARPGRTTRAPTASSTTCAPWSRGWPTRSARRSPSISCARCGAWSRSSASPPSASTCARTPPAPPRRCRRSGSGRTARTATPPDVDSPEWKAWLHRRAGAAADRAERSFEDLPDDARETLETFALVGEMREQLDREAFGCFILSMTRSVQRHPRRLPARQGGRQLPRRGRHRDLLPADRAAVRDHRRPARRARHHEGAVRRSRWCAAPRAGRAACRR